MQPFELARIRPQTLLGLGVAGGILAGIFVLWLLARAVERVADRPRVPRPGMTYGVFLVLAAASAAVGITAFSVNQLFLDHTRLLGPLRLGYLRCEPLPEGRVRATFVAEVLAEGRAIYDGSGPIDVSDEVGSTCRLEATIVTMRALPRRIAGRYLARATAVGQTERSRLAGARWRPETRQFPLSLLVREATRVEASAPADPTGRWAVIAMPPETASDGAAPTVLPVLGLQRIAP